MATGTAWKPVGSAAIVLLAGVLLGVSSRVEERVAGFSLGLSSDAMWVACAFAAGAMAQAAPAGAVRGAAVLTVANAAYYGVILATEPAYLVAVAGRPSMWLALGAGGGALFGAAGALWRAGTPHIRLAAALLVAAVLVADGAPALRGAPAGHAISLGAGVAFLLASARTPLLRRGAALAAGAVVLVAATGGLEPLLP